MKNRSLFQFMWLGALLCTLASCKRSGTAPAPGEEEQRETGIVAALLSPAGSVQSWDFDAERGEYRQGQALDFLPYPANFGYLPATRREGGGRPLEVLLIGQRIERREAGIQPLALLRYATDTGEKGALIVAVPQRASFRTIEATSFREFFIEYDAAKRILETWLLHHRGYGRIGILGWEDEQAAMREIQTRSRQN